MRIFLSFRNASHSSLPLKADENKSGTTKMKSIQIIQVL